MSSPASDKRSPILRAEILRSGPAEVTCALELAPDSVFIVTDDLPSIGDVIGLRLSFPRTVAPLTANARVRQVRMFGGPGSPSGFVADFAIERDEVKRALAELVRRLRPASDTAPGVRELEVLLVEDNELIRDMFVYAVERYFGQRARLVHLAQAATASAAWRALAEKQRLDLAIVDHRLPDETGASFVTALRREPRFRGTPIIGMSVGGAEVQRAMLAAGADLFLHKPIVLKDLFCTLEFLMSCEPEGELGAA